MTGWNSYIQQLLHVHGKYKVKQIITQEAIQHPLKRIKSSWWKKTRCGEDLFTWIVQRKWVEDLWTLISLLEHPKDCLKMHIPTTFPKNKTLPELGPSNTKRWKIEFDQCQQLCLKMLREVLSGRITFQTIKSLSPCTYPRWTKTWPSLQAIKRK